MLKFLFHDFVYVRICEFVDEANKIVFVIYQHARLQKCVDIILKTFNLFKILEGIFGAKI